MSRLNCTYKEFIEILEANKFEKVRQEGSHQTWRGVIGNKVQTVIVAPHGSLKTQIGLNTLQSMIRQSGLSKKLFRK